MRTLPERHRVIGERQLLLSKWSEAAASFDVDLFNLQRLYMANRGIWEAIYSAGPACGAETTGEQVDLYLEVLDGFLSELPAGRQGEASKEA